MSERAEVIVGVVVLVVVLSMGLGVHYRSALSQMWDGSATSASSDGSALHAPEAFREGVPAFGSPATSAELAIVAPLTVGSDLDGWEVEGIDTVTNGTLTVHLFRRGSRLSLDVGLSEGATTLAPAVAGPYAIYATHLFGEHARGTTAGALAEALGRVIERNLSAARPPGLRAFAPTYEPTGEPAPSDAAPAEAPPIPSEALVPAPEGLVPDVFTDVPGR